MVCTERLSFTFFTLKLLTLFILIPHLLAGCSNLSTNNASAHTPSKNRYLVSHPSKATTKKINAIMPVALKWYDNVGRSLYASGRALSVAEIKMAKKLGVKKPKAVRVVILDKFPEPDGYIKNNNHIEGARAMGNIIMIKPHFKNNSTIICHELVHVAQKDRMGLRGFLKQIALEKEILGYSGSMLENEAYALQQPIEP